ncbi:MAG: hypothetical protein JSS89_13090 [Bacteroidetes bacterium]|nr:hypothetical protein [Bacteroidota bacterium]
MSHIIIAITKIFCNIGDALHGEYGHSRVTSTGKRRGYNRIPVGDIPTVTADRKNMQVDFRLATEDLRNGYRRYVDTHSEKV